MLKLFYAPTTATTKVMLLLEEIGCEYKKIPVNVRKGVQTYSTYKTIVLNGKVPALIDDSKVYMESGNILLHLAEKHNVLYPAKVNGQVILWSKSSQSAFKGKLGFKILPTKGYFK